MATYDALRRQSRTLESLIDTKLNAYSRLATSSASSAGTSREVDLEHGGSERWSDMEAEIEGLLDKLRETNDDLFASLETPSTRSSQTATHAVQRHKDILQDYVRDFNRTKTNVQQARDRANLLQNVRSDIDAYKATRSNAADMLLAERGRIDSSHQMTDDLLSQAYETRSEFGRQRASIASINTRVAGVLNTFPSINSIVSMISNRRRREAVITGLVVGVCVLILLSYMSH